MNRYTKSMLIYLSLFGGIGEFIVGVLNTRTSLWIGYVVSVTQGSLESNFHLFVITVQLLLITPEFLQIIGGLRDGQKKIKALLYNSVWLVFLQVQSTFITAVNLS